MKDFCSMPERDYIRLIAAQDLRDSGIDVAAAAAADMSLSMSSTSSSHQFANVTAHYHTYHHHSHHNHHTTYNGRGGTSGGAMITPSKNLHNSSLNAAANKYHTNTMNDYHHHSHLQHDGGGGPTSNNPSGGGNRPRPTFGVELKKIESVTVTVNEQQLSVPTFLKSALEHIEHKFLLNEGIFRKSGGSAIAKDLRAQIEQGNYNFSLYQNMGDMTSVVKSFIREIPGSLLTYPLYASFIQAAKLTEQQTRLDALLNLCLQLPDAHLHLLIYLMNFLHQVTLHDSVNKMNSFNLATIFAPNIIINPDPTQSNVYLNEERTVTQTLIENSSLIGRVSDSVYERSLMLNELCNSTAANKDTSNNANGSGTVSNTGVIGGVSSSLSSNTASGGGGCVSDYNYDSDFPDNTSFAHHAQSIGSTSLSSYSTTSSSKKDKKKRRSSSLKELMNTIQNSISSKFRRRSASEKNDKTTCSIITTGGLNDASTTNIGDVTTCSNSRFMSASTTSSSHHHHHHHNHHYDTTPFIHHHGGGGGGGTNRQILMMTPLCGATPRINKRNAEESLQSTTKKKLIEKLPQRNLLLPDAPRTPFATSKKNKYQFKLPSNGGGKDVANKTDLGGNSSSSSNNNGKPPISSNNMGSMSMAATPLQTAQKAPQTPATLTNSNVKDSSNAITTTTSNSNSNAIITASSNLGLLHKQLKYEESPSVMMSSSSANQHTSDLASFKPKYVMMDPSTNNKRLINNSNNVTCGASSSSSSSSKNTSSGGGGCCHRHHHHHNHNHHHHHSSSSHHNHHYHTTGGGGGSSNNCSGTSSGHRSSNKHKHHHHHNVGLYGATGGGGGVGAPPIHHHHHHKESVSSSSSSRAHCTHSSHHHHKSSTTASSSSKQQHHYVNAIPFSPSKSSKTTSQHRGVVPRTKYNELSTQIINGNINGNIKISSNNTECHTSRSSSSSSSSSSSLLNSSRSTVSLSPSPSEASIASSSVCSSKKKKNQTTTGGGGNKPILPDTNFHTTMGGGMIERSVIGDNSMRCTLRRGRPNTPKTGLSGADYRTRKTSVPNTPEAKHFIQLRANNTISNTDDILQRIENRVAVAQSRKKSKVELGSSCSLNTALIQAIGAVAGTANAAPVNMEKNNTGETAVNNGDEEEVEGSNDARLLDMAFNEDDLTDTEDNVGGAGGGGEDMCNERIGSVSSSCVSSPSINHHHHHHHKQRASAGDAATSAVEEEGALLVNHHHHHRHISLSMSNIPDNLTTDPSGGDRRGGGGGNGLDNEYNNTSTVSSSESMCNTAANRTTVSESVVLGMTTTFSSGAGSSLCGGGVKKSLADFSGSIDKLGESCMAERGGGGGRSSSNDQSSCFHQEQTDFLSTTNSQQQMETSNDDVACEIKNPIIEEQQKLIKFEPFNEFKMPHEMPMHTTPPFIKLPNEDTASSGQFVLDRREDSTLDESSHHHHLGGGLVIDHAALNETLRRQSLFQLKDSLVGKVSRQVNEIEKRKKSPRKDNKSYIESSSSSDQTPATAATNSANLSVTKRYVSPVRIPSIFSKKSSESSSSSTVPQDQYVINNKSKYISENKLSKTIATCLAEKRKKSVVLGNKTNEAMLSTSSSPLIVKAATQFCRRHMTRNRSVKRLNSTSLSSYHGRSNLSAISEGSNNTPSSNKKSNQKSVDNDETTFATTNNNTSTAASPSLLLSNKLKCTSESIDL